MTPRKKVGWKIIINVFFNVFACLFGTLRLFFGLKGIFRPRSTLAILGFHTPTRPADQKLVDSLIVLYGVRDVFVATAIYVASWVGNSKTLGCMLLAANPVTLVDGWVVEKQLGKGGWKHWWYTVVLGFGVGFLVARGLGGRRR